MEHANILFVTIVFVAGHLASPAVSRRRDRWREQVSSFSAGFAVAYVCLYLLPELDAAHEVFGSRIYGVMLVGFALFYGLEVWIVCRHQAEGHYTLQYYGVNLAMVAVYNAMMVFTIALQPTHDPLLTIVYALAIGLHLMSLDMSLQERYGDRFVANGRLVLIAAVLAGYGLSWLRRPEEVVIDVITAVLAGAMVLNVFRAELPEIKYARYRYFLAGIVLFTALHVVLAREMGE